MGKEIRGEVKYRGTPPLSVIAKSAAMKQSGNTHIWIASLLRACQ
jgi:hypothetical protein